MKERNSILPQKLTLVFILSIFLLTLFSFAEAQTISYVSPDLSEGKYVLYVDNKPFYITGIQVRLDKLKGYLTPHFNAAAREAVIKRCADDYFNTLQIPIQWIEVEPTKDHFDWTILDEYLGYCKKYSVKMELLWFSWCSGGRVQWLLQNELGKQIRTPDYVCSQAGTSEFTILQKTDPWTLDWFDNRLRDRETYVLGKVMEHVAEWDKKNGSPHTIIGVQLGNEALGRNVPASQIVDYYHHVGAAVKNSKYVVWTRLNCIVGMAKGRIAANEAKRVQAGTNIDFVGLDIYRTSADLVKGDYGGRFPFEGKNYQTYMESGAEVPKAAVFQVAALAGNKGYEHYDLAGPDDHGLYDVKGTTIIPHGDYVNDVRTVNYLFNTDIIDIATKGSNNSVYVHNWAGNSTTPTTGTVEGISFIPADTLSQGISIKRSKNEIVLMNTRGGTFNYPSSIGIIRASKGYFDKNNKWVSEANLSFTSTSITPPVGKTVRLLYSKQKGK